VQSRYLLLNGIYLLRLLLLSGSLNVKQLLKFDSFAQQVHTKCNKEDKDNVIDFLKAYSIHPVERIFLMSDQFLEIWLI
jgi:hypothetical protein